MTDRITEEYSPTTRIDGGVFAWAGFNWSDLDKLSFGAQGLLWKLARDPARTWGAEFVHTGTSDPPHIADGLLAELINIGVVEWVVWA